MKSPVFIFSLPRSGSTLLQRVLSTHSEVATQSEPWIMLPFIYALRKEGTLSEYGHLLSFSAIEDFIGNLPNQEDDFFKHLNEFFTNLYSDYCRHNEIYFLDKTPRYYNIINEIQHIFPNAKFIFLFRNPVHVKSSMLETWSNGSFWKCFAYHRDLYYGPKALAEGYRLLEKKSYALKYEDFVKNPEESLKEICTYLEINFESSMLDKLTKNKLHGRLGDSTGVREYTSISTKSLEKWKMTFNTHFRKKILKNYVLKLDTNIFDIAGYDKIKILEEINTHRTTCCFICTCKDIIQLIFSKLVVVLKLNLFLDSRIVQWVRKNYLS